ncbi:MAG: helix-turn-helix domain-containing protein [Armatimonadetes bacterium]|nr:helix-turn-helix domain-containing protein [Armatimonadota bacterium]
MQLFRHNGTMHDSPEGIGATLKSLRRERGVSIGTLAAQSGIHKTTLYRWESGATVPRLPELSHVLDALGVSAQTRAQCHERVLAPRAVQWLKSQDAGVLTVGDLLRALRLRSGLTQSEAARRSGVRQSLLTQWENGLTLPGGAGLHALCFALGGSGSEAAYLTTRATGYRAPVPRNRDTIFDAMEDVIWSDLSPDKDLSFLSLAAQMGSLYEKQRVELRDVAAVWARHAQWLRGNGTDRASAFRIARRALTVAQNDTAPLSPHVFTALYTLHGVSSGNPIEANIAALYNIRDKVAGLPQKAWLESLLSANMAYLAPEAAVSLTRKSVQTAQEGGAAAEVLFRQSDLCHLLLRLDRLSEAQSVLETMTPPNKEQRYQRVSLLLAMAELMARQGNRIGAEIQLAEVETQIKAHGLHGIRANTELVSRRIRGYAPFTAAQ